MSDDGYSPPTTYHLRASLVIGGLVGSLAFVLAGLMRITTIGQIKIGLVVGLSVAALFGVWWTYKSTTYRWRIGEAELRRRWKREETRAEEETESETETETTPQKAAALDRLARLLIEREYLDGLSTTREICEAMRICNQGEWNAVNRVLREAGIKGERGWRSQSYTEAITLYRQRVRVEGETILIQKNENEWLRWNVSVVQR
jgi:hypothetical protein